MSAVLPANWASAKDPSSGKTYYFNVADGRTQWEVPKAEMPSVANGTVVAAMRPVLHQHQASANTMRNVSQASIHKPQRGIIELSDLPIDPGADDDVRRWRQEREVTVANRCATRFARFEDAPLPSQLRSLFAARGFEAPSPIQGQTWPAAFEGRDVVGVAKTGSGKTLAFLVPCFKVLCGNNACPMPATSWIPRALVLAPTRELASQIGDEAVKFGAPLGISAMCCFGGAPKGPQLGELRRGAHLVVATPGRLNDLLEASGVSLSRAEYLVFDEADRMLDMGFEPQIRKIVTQCPEDRQTLFFTATWPVEVRRLASEFLADPVVIYVGDAKGSLNVNADVTQRVHILQPADKEHLLVELLAQTAANSARVVVFCNAKKSCDTLERTIPRHLPGVRCAALHGDKDQFTRTRTLDAFKTGVCPVLIATDVAARGLDVKGVHAVVNYDMPQSIEDYVHRVGRTGRAGAKGIAHTFFTPRDDRKAAALINLLRDNNEPVPDDLQAFAARAAVPLRQRDDYASQGADRHSRTARGAGISGVRSEPYLRNDHDSPPRRRRRRDDIDSPPQQPGRSRSRDRVRRRSDY